MGIFDKMKSYMEANGSHSFEEQMFAGQIVEFLRGNAVPDVPVSITSVRKPELYIDGSRGVELDYVLYKSEVLLVSIVESPGADVLYPDRLISFFEGIVADCGYWAEPKLGFNFFWTQDSRFAPEDKLATWTTWNFAFDDCEPNLLVVQGPVKTGEEAAALMGGGAPVVF